ncbi:dimethylsulfonioproprionate lyase family protein [Arvimicrobium flavum]|uniref:dimethylsulfonioproprionate lyase family protein n=1 Tax=Arvimicrobium flavum TaxID=3393320 RepID=UPI00237BBA22|nr:dimethylsulfonioproprionate lyase family protein [Mesorhizobium shangrilense]
MTTPLDELLGAFLDHVATFGEPVASFAAMIDRSMPVRRLEARTLPVVEILPRCVAAASPAARKLADLLVASEHLLQWGQTYTAQDFGPAFMQNYGWVELCGTRGRFASDSVAGGFLLLGPHTTYPDHHHTAEEVYLPLTGGTEWRKGRGGFQPAGAGEVIHHPSNVSHAMRTGSEPLLAIYLWRGGPLAQKSAIGVAEG